MVKQFYELEVGSSEFIRMHREIKNQYKNINTAMDNYYKLLKQQGGDPKSCWLTDELENGIYCLDQMYIAIADVVQTPISIKDFPNVLKDSAHTI